MMSAAVQRELVVFPSELARRRRQQDQVLASGWVDASGQTTQAHLRELLELYARKAGLLEYPPCDSARQLLLLRQAVARARGRFTSGGPLAVLSDNALTDILDLLVRELSGLADDAAAVTDWLAGHHPCHRLHQLSQLYCAWRELLQERGFCDQRDRNTAVLNLLKKDPAHWPPLLRRADRIVFRSIRWLTPFDEAVMSALQQQLGSEKIAIYSLLPSAHAEQAEDRLDLRIRSEILAPVEDAWTAWMEDLGDALEVNSPDLLQKDDVRRISFSRSAGAYGEIEDLARRICREIEESGCPPNRIALVVPDIGKFQDIVPHVFGRFSIPYFFRRGRPVLSSPCVKAFFSLLSFPQRCRRDHLIDLIRNPAIKWECDREELVNALTRSAAPPRLSADDLPPGSSDLDPMEVLKTRMVAEGSFNTAALEAVERALDVLGAEELPLPVLLDLLEKLLENETIHSGKSDEQGVWVINPYDAAGLQFDVVMFAGLNDGEFPSISQQSALLNDAERFHLRRQLAKAGIHLPKLALPQSDALMVQQTVLFLSVLGMAREQLVLSCQAVDKDGSEKAPSGFYRKVHELAASGELSAYDRWRCAIVPGLKPELGESFLPVVPLPLCRAKDEALQSAVQLTTESLDRPVEKDFPVSGQIERVVEMLRIESEREQFLETPEPERQPSAYCGYTEGLKEQIACWLEQKGELAPTALEALAQGRYIFLLERIFGIREGREADDTPDPMDRGTLWHSILCSIYKALSGDLQVLEKLNIVLNDDWREICRPYGYAVKTEQGWKKTNAPADSAVPLVGFSLAEPEVYAAFSDAVTLASCTRAERRSVRLGHPGVWQADREKLLIEVRNLVMLDAATAAKENRFPAFFELPFSKEHDVPVSLCGIGLKGHIDRVDLTFSGDELSGVRVLDYKGGSRARAKREEYIDEIHRNLDCQLPVYAFAAQQKLFGKYNTEELNTITEAGYLFRERDPKEVGKKAGKSLVSMDEPELIETFLDTLSGNIQKLRAGDFSVDPLIETFNDYQSICRVAAIKREELD